MALCFIEDNTGLVLNMFKLYAKRLILNIAGFYYNTLRIIIYDQICNIFNFILSKYQLINTEQKLV